MLVLELTCLIGIIIVIAMVYAYRTTRDPLHPMMLLGPLCLYAYVYKPSVLAYFGAVQLYFDDRDLVYVQLVNFAGVAAFCIGAVWHCSKVSKQQHQIEQPLIAPDVRHRALEVACLLGVIAAGTFWFFTSNIGGLSVAYGQTKGGITLSSGYLGELPMLSLPAIVLLFFAWTGQRIGPGKIALLLIFATPLLVHGLLGARRGPTFMILAALLVGHYAVSNRRPKLPTVLLGTFMVGALLLFLLNNRHRIALNSSALDQWTSSADQFDEPTIDAGDDWIFSAGSILTSRDSETHYWGRRFLVNIFVRPIPRQAWQNKYVSTGFAWLDDQSEMLGMSDNEWVASVGWVPSRGSAAGFVADFYLEFWLFGVVGCLALGWFYGLLWRGMVKYGGVWAMLYLYGCILSIYVPTQNVTEAWLYRFLLFVIPTVLTWRFYIAPQGAKPSYMFIQPAPMPVRGVRFIRA